MFQHTATRRWLRFTIKKSLKKKSVSTHSHPKVAASQLMPMLSKDSVSTHSHPKVAAIHNKKGALICGFQHTATRRWLQAQVLLYATTSRFQHTATRRWLPRLINLLHNLSTVSTHSHPKVAAWTVNQKTHQPKFQHTATRRWLPMQRQVLSPPITFQHTATRRWLLPT